MDQVTPPIVPLSQPGTIRHDSRVWHIVLRSSARPLRPERLATFVLPPDELARIGARKVERAVMQARAMWAGVAVRAGYVGPEWRVDVVREVGFVRSLFPGAAIAGAPQPVAPGGSPDG
jgi:hypothetical protein